VPLTPNKSSVRGPFSLFRCSNPDLFSASRVERNSGYFTAITPQRVRSSLTKNQGNCDDNSVSILLDQWMYHLLVVSSGCCLCIFCCFPVLIRQDGRTPFGLPNGLSHPTCQYYLVLSCGRVTCTSQMCLVIYFCLVTYLILFPIFFLSIFHILIPTLPNTYFVFFFKWFSFKCNSRPTLFTNS